MAALRLNKGLSAYFLKKDEMKWSEMSKHTLAAFLLQGIKNSQVKSPEHRGILLQRVWANVMENN